MAGRWRQIRPGRFLEVGLLVAIATTTIRCVSVVTPPSDPTPPETVFLVFEAFHKGLVLPEDDGTWHEWGYGEWGWYAKNEDAWYDVFSTVLWPTAGALGRRDLGKVAALAIPALYAPAKAVPLVVARGRVVALREKLWKAYRSRIDTECANPEYGLHLVRFEPDYWFLHDCDDEMADWLRALGCRVTALPIRLGLTVDPPGVGPGSRKEGREDSRRLPPCPVRERPARAYS